MVSAMVSFSISLSEPANRSFLYLAVVWFLFLFKFAVCLTHIRQIL